MSVLLVCSDVSYYTTWKMRALKWWSPGTKTAEFHKVLAIWYRYYHGRELKPLRALIFCHLSPHFLFFPLTQFYFR